MFIKLQHIPVMEHEGRHLLPTGRNERQCVRGLMTRFNSAAFCLIRTMMR